MPAVNPANPTPAYGRIATIEARPQAVSLDTSACAVLVIDMQNDFGSKGGMFARAGIDISMIQRAVEPTCRVLATARRHAIPVIYLKMAFKPDLSDAGPTDSPNLIRHQLLGVGTEVPAPDGSTSRILVRDTWNTDIVDELAPNLVARNSIGHVGAAQLLLTAGDNPQRLRSEAGFAALCGVSPVPASSGKTARHRLNRGGDRAANSALHIIAIGRLRTDAQTQTYVAKRIAEGHSKMEAIRCLKRYIAREVFRLIKQRQKEINRTRIAA